MASWVPDSWADARIDAEHQHEQGDKDIMVDLWNNRLGQQPVIPGGRQVPVVYREPLPAKWFVTEKAVIAVRQMPTLFGEQSCPKCSGKLDDDSYCNFCGHLGAAA